MADISMCRNKVCPKRNECYRFVAKPSLRRQSYIAAVYDNGCRYFWPVQDLATSTKDEQVAK